jgi:8-oxo-dGTP pyrophosphatase MutT (NUDIX family)
VPSKPSEISAGGIVVDDQGRMIVIVPTRRAAGGSRVTALPKGHIDPGEDAPTAALREVREEAGVEAEIVQHLGDVKYWYQRDGKAIPKQVSFFLMKYLGGDPADHDHEVEVARWIPLHQALDELSFPGERKMVRAAIAYRQEQHG